MQVNDFTSYVVSDFKRTDKNSEILQAYNDMITWVAVQMPHGDYKYQSYINTTVGVEDYSLPCNMIHLIHPIRLLLGSGTSDSGVTLEHLTKEQYDILEPNPNRTTPSKGQPSGYTVYSRSLLLTPIPDLATYIIEINWTKRPTRLQNDDDQPELHDEWQEVLKWGVLERLYAGLQQYEESQFWGSKYHTLVNGDDIPIGLCRRLLEIEKDREGSQIGFIQNNSL